MILLTFKKLIMNYSTLKKTFVFSLVALLALVEVSNAQTATNSTAKVFGGRGQYRTWNFGINAGILTPHVVVGGINDYNKSNFNLGYGLTLRKQLGHSFGLELAGVRGKLSGENDATVAPLTAGSYAALETELAVAA